MRPERNPPVNVAKTVVRKRTAKGSGIRRISRDTASRPPSTTTVSRGPPQRDQNAARRRIHTRIRFASVRAEDRSVMGASCCKPPGIVPMDERNLAQQQRQETVPGSPGARAPSTSARDGGGDEAALLRLGRPVRMVLDAQLLHLLQPLSPE